MAAQLFLLSLVPLLVGGSPVPSPTPLPTPYSRVVARNHAGPPSSYTTGADPTTTSPQSAEASASQTSQQSTFFGGGIPSQLLDWIAVVIVVGIVVSLVCARYFFVKRFYPVTIRSYFLPPAGLHVQWLHLHIKGPPPRPNLNTFVGAIPRRARRRDQPTFGPDIAEGGRRTGARDEDDMIDDDAEMGVIGPRDDELPKYEVDASLPSYAKDERTAAARRSRRVPPPAVEATATRSGDVRVPDEVDALPSVQAYEEATRESRAIAAARQERISVDTNREAVSSSGSSLTTVTTGSTRTKVDEADEVDVASRGKEVESVREADVGEAVIPAEHVGDREPRTAGVDEDREEG